MPITKIQITPPIGRVIEANILKNGSCEILIEVPEKMKEKSKPPILDSDLVLVDAESLSLEDEFMQYVPKNDREKETKRLITEVIKKGVKNFYKPKGDVSFTEDGNGICYSPGQKPAVGKSFDWHEKAAKNFMPERNSRLGSRLEYGAFLGVLIKELVAEGKTVEWAWNAVCCESRELGHYWNSENAKHTLEPTGSREICGFCDLGNTYKILAWEAKAGGFWLAGSYFNNYSYNFPLAELYYNLYSCRDNDFNFSVGWLVLS